MQIGGEVCGEQTPWASFLHLPGILELWGPKHDLATPPNPSVKLIAANIPVLFRMYLAFEKYIKAVSIRCLVQHKGRRLLVTSLGGVVHPAAINKPPHLPVPISLSLAAVQLFPRSYGSFAEVNSHRLVTTVLNCTFSYLRFPH